MSHKSKPKEPAHDTEAASFTLIMQSGLREFTVGRRGRRCRGGELGSRARQRASRRGRGWGVGLAAADGPPLGAVENNGRVPPAARRNGAAASTLTATPVSGGQGCTPRCWWGLAQAGCGQGSQRFLPSGGSRPCAGGSAPPGSRTGSQARGLVPFKSKLKTSFEAWPPERLDFPDFKYLSCYGLCYSEDRG